jgi:protein-S-isoprenylcysteine O-methyltransferase Ste14
MGVGLPPGPYRGETVVVHAETARNEDAETSPEPTNGSVPPPTPGLAEHATRAGRWLFRWRSYFPLWVLAYILVLLAFDPTPVGGEGALWAWVASGVVLGLTGLAIRAWTLGHAPSGTSGRGTKELRAETLTTTGLYSVVRHPLYLGNFLLWMGAVTFAAKPTALLFTALFFWLYYERIMMAEERFLYERFDDVFREWARTTPGFLPRLSGWVTSPHPFSLRYCLGRDYQAVYGFVAATTVIEVTRSVSSGSGWIPRPGWIAYFLAGTAVYFVFHTLKRRTRLLEARDR